MPHGQHGKSLATVGVLEVVVGDASARPMTAKPTARIRMLSMMCSGVLWRS
jgi:hypothetical protein